MSGTTLNSCNDFELEIYYFRTIGGVTTDKIYVSDIMINGDFIYTVYDSEAQLPNNGDIAILTQKDIYKIFSLDNFYVYSAPHNSYDIKYRFTQDAGITYTLWEPLTKENISTVKLNPLRFCQVEYMITNTGNQGLLIYDVILEGDFQNVSANSLKINRYGLKQDCLTAMLNTPGMPGSDNINRDFYTSCLGSYAQKTDTITDIANLNSNNKSTLWNPYQSEKITQFANLLGNQVSSLFGHNVEYHLTDPDGNGIDMFMHEHTLKNIIDVKNVQVIVNDNKFPSETMIVNQFNLDLFDVFEIQIMKDEFKNKFGIIRRPSEDDIVYICETNMLYYVKHSQAFRNVMNTSTYYKVILEKYEFKTNIRNLNAESKAQIDALTNNTTIEDLLSSSNKLEGEKIANKEQLYPTTFDKIRQKISSKVTINKEKIDVNNFEVAKQYYDLSYPALKNKLAIDYTKVDQNLLKSDNRSFIFWFKFNNSYSPDLRPNNSMFMDYNIKGGEEFNLLNNHINNTGYKIYYQGGSLYFKLNEVLYKLTQPLLTNVWYSGVINLDQRQGKLDMYIYRRNTEITVTLFNTTTFNKEDVILNSTEYTDFINNGYRPATNTESTSNSDFELVSTISIDINPIEFEHTESMNLLGSNIKYTNLRVLDEVIPINSITNILKQNIITDEQHLILADNATKQIIAKNYYNKNFR